MQVGLTTDPVTLAYRRGGNPNPKLKILNHHETTSMERKYSWKENNEVETSINYITAPSSLLSTP